MIDSIKVMIVITSLLLPAVSHANNKCSDSTTIVNQAVLADLEIWKGRIRMLDFMSGEKPISKSSSPVYFDSISNAVENQKSKISDDVITLGEAFPVYTINSDNILANKGNKSVLSLTEFTGVWFIPAFIANRAVSIVEVKCKNDQLKVVSIGAKPLVETIVAFDKSVKSTAVKVKRFIEMHQPMGSFIATEEDAGEVVYPLTFSDEYLTLPQKNSVGGGYAPEHVITLLSNKLRAVK
jgi:hypothetical protein